MVKEKEKETTWKTFSLYLTKQATLDIVDPISMQGKKNTRKKQGQYPFILTKQAWSVKVL